VTPIQRLQLSERVITGWEAQGGPRGRLGIIWEELSYLRRIALDEPALIERVAAVIERYERAASKLRSASN